MACAEAFEQADPNSATPNLGDNITVTSKASAFLVSPWEMLKQEQLKPQDFRTSFEKVANLSPPDAWCCAVALQAALERDPKPRHAGQWIARVDEFRNSLSQEDRSKLDSCVRACSELEFVPHVHTEAEESKRLTRDEHGRVLLQVGNRRTPMQRLHLNKRRRSVAALKLHALKNGG